MEIPTTELARKDLREELQLRKLIADVEDAELNLARKKAQAAAHRVYTFSGPVNGTSIPACMQELGIWSREAPGAKLTMIFNSPGGLVDEGLALYDYMLHLRSLGHHITTVALGRAASMGGILLQAGDVRVMGPNAFLLCHEVAAGTNGKLSEMQDNLDHWKRQELKLLEILAHRSKLTVAQIKRRWKKFDWWLDAAEAIELGLVDEVLGPQHLSSGS